MLASIYKAVNRLLPFATPGTPVATDLIHLVLLCSLLYFAPQIQAYLQSRNDGTDGASAPAAAPHPEEDAPAPGPAPQQQQQQQQQAAPQAGQQGPEPVPAPPRQHPAPLAEQAQAGPVPEPNVALPNDGPADVPAAAAGARPIPTNVGAKKARSLARRDQRRAHNEFVRAQGEAARARDAEGAAERMAMEAAERARRTAAEGELRAREARETQERKERERRAEAAEARARVGAVGLARAGVQGAGFVDLNEVAGRVGRERGWVEALVRADGLLEGREGEGEVAFVTESGWLVRVDVGMMDEVWRVLERRVNVGGADRVGFDEVGNVLEGVLRGRNAMKV